MQDILLGLAEKNAHHIEVLNHELGVVCVNLASLSASLTWMQYVMNIQLGLLLFVIGCLFRLAGTVKCNIDALDKGKSKI